jgi:hypothetical protein
MAALWGWSDAAKFNFNPSLTIKTDWLRKNRVTSAAKACFIS